MSVEIDHTVKLFCGKNVCLVNNEVGGNDIAVGGMTICIEKIIHIIDRLDDTFRCEIDRADTDIVIVYFNPEFEPVIFPG